MTSTVPSPAPSRARSSLSAARGHGSRSSGAASARRCRVPAAIGSWVRAAVAARRSTRAGSRETCASRARTTSPACSTTPSSSGRRAGGRRSAARPRRGRAERAERRAVSVAKTTVRAAPDRARARSKRSVTPRSAAAAATTSWASSACITSRARPARRCSSTRRSSISAPRVLDVDGGPVDQLRRGERVEQLDVAQTPVAVLEVGLDAVRDLARALPARRRGGDEVVEAVPDARAPRLAGRGGQALGEVRVAREVADLEQAQRHPQVGGGDLDGLAHRAHRVVQPDPGVPERVPERVRDAGDALLVPPPAAPVVHEDEVEIGVRRELPAPESTDRHQRRALPHAHRGGARGEPEVVQFHERLTQRARSQAPRAGRRVEQRVPRAEQVRGVAVAARGADPRVGARGSGPAPLRVRRHPPPRPLRRARRRPAFVPRTGNGRVPPSTRGDDGAGSPCRGPGAVVVQRLQGVGPALAGAHAHHGLDRGHPDLPVTDLAGAGGLGDRVDDLLRGGVVA